MGLEQKFHYGNTPAKDNHMSCSNASNILAPLSHDLRRFDFDSREAVGYGSFTLCTSHPNALKTS